MKLNNKGWGLDTLLICITVIILALIIIIANAHKLSEIITNNNTQNTYINNNNTVEDKNEEIQLQPEDYYKQREAALSVATINYLNDNNIKASIYGSLVIELQELIDYDYMKPITNQDKTKKCAAFAYANAKDNIYVVNSYIKCDDYETEGYSDYK